MVTILFVFDPSLLQWRRRLIRLPLAKRQTLPVLQPLLHRLACLQRVLVLQCQETSSGRAGPSAGPEKWPEHVAPVRRPEAPEQLLSPPYPTAKILEGSSSRADYAEKEFSGDY